MPSRLYHISLLYTKSEDWQDIQIFAIVPEFLINAPLVKVKPLAIYPAAAVPPATAYYQRLRHYDGRRVEREVVDLHLQVT